VATPYITPDILNNAPTGMSWETIPDFDSLQTAQLAEQTNICWRTTHFIDTYCNQPLRATIDTEEVLGPDYRLTIDHNGLARFLTSRWPVTAIISAQWSASYVVPAAWNPIPANQMFIESTSVIDGGISTISAAGPSAIRIAPGYVSWLNGRGGCRLQVTYQNGFAHAGVVADVAAGATQLHVDDCTGMTGKYMHLYDGQLTEFTQVLSASTTTGAGVVTLAEGLSYSHSASAQKPLIISSLPASVQQAAIFYATYAALTRGATATTVQAMPGVVTGGVGTRSSSLLQDARDLLQPYRRVL
jgi:hypothetical protein